MTSTSTPITRLLSPLRLALCGALSLGLVACVGGEKETDSSADSETSATDSDGTTGGSDGTSSGSASSTGGTDSGTDGTTGSGTDSDSAGGTSTTGDADTTTGGDSATTDSGTTGQANPGLKTACEEACEVLLGCYPDEWPSLDACAEECVDGSGGQGEACELAALDFLECMAALTCVELEEGACGEEEDAAVDACEGDICSVGVGGGVGECGVIEECADGTRQMNCEGETCVCLVDDELVGECANDVCLDEEPEPDAIEQKALSCCGFEI